MDEQRKRLIQIIGNANTKLRQEFPYVVGQERIEKIADYLLANGVLVPPCRIGDKLWWACDESYRIFDEDPDIGVYEDEKGVQSIAFDGANFGVLIDGVGVPFGSQFAFLSEADARDWLEKTNEREGVI